MSYKIIENLIYTICNLVKYKSRDYRNIKYKDLNNYKNQI